MTDTQRDTDAERADQIRARADAATDGPWHVDSFPAGTVGFYVRAADGRLIETFYEPTRDNPEFIAAARSDVPWLLDRLAAETAEKDALRDQITIAEWPVETLDKIIELNRHANFEDLWQEAEASLAAATERADKAEAAARAAFDALATNDQVVLKVAYAQQIIIDAALFPAEEAPSE